MRTYLIAKIYYNCSLLEKMSFAENIYNQICGGKYNGDILWYNVEVQVLRDL